MKSPCTLNAFRFTLFLWLLCCFGVHAQVLPCDGVASFGKEKLIVKLDPLTGIPEGDVPFDRYFLIQRKYREGVEVVDIVLEYKGLNHLPFSVSKVEESGEKFVLVTAVVPPLLPQKTSTTFYILRKLLPDELEERFKAFEFLSKGGSFDNLFVRKVDEISTQQERVGDRGVRFVRQYRKYFEEALRSLFESYQAERSPFEQARIKEKILNVMTTVPFDGASGPEVMFLSSQQLTQTSTQSTQFQTRTQYVVTPDMGVVTYGQPAFLANATPFWGVTPYVGICLNFRSYDPDVPLKKIKCHLSGPDRFSVNLGLALGSVAKAGYRDDLFAGGRSLLLGMGYRVTNALKINAGALGYVRLSDNTLLDNKEVCVTPYVGLSIDLRVREALKDIGDFFKGTVLPTVKL